MGGKRNWGSVEVQRKVARGAEPVDGGSPMRQRLTALRALFRGDEGHAARLARYLSSPARPMTAPTRSPVREKWLRDVLGPHSPTRAYYDES